MTYSLVTTDGHQKPSHQRLADDCRAGLRQIRFRMLYHSMRLKLAGSRWRAMIAILCSLFFWGALFFVFLEGFRFLDKHRLVTGPLIELLFGMFFGSLLVMLVFSTSIILYGGLFRSQEADFLLLRPIPPDGIFAFKFQEAIAFSSWGFLLLGTPMMTAYGISTGCAWWFYVMAIPYFLAFALLPGSMGALLTLLVARYAPTKRRTVLITLAVALVALLLAFLARALIVSENSPSAERWVTSIFQQLRVSNLPFLPSQWISRGLLSAGYPGGFSDSALYLVVLVSNALALYVVTAWAYHLLYRAAYDRVRSAGSAKRKRTRTLLPRIVDRLFFPFAGPVKVLLVKDVRIFSRDPMQWLQVLIFTGLLSIYFANLQGVTLFSNSPYWRNLLGFFNVAVTGLLLSAFTSRFIFPLMSLEGQKFWILGLAPIKRSSILWGKFAFSLTGSMIVTLFLTLISAYMLSLEPLLIMLQVVSMIIVCFGVSGIAVGLGAKFPEMGETDPSKIASGFGGTINLLASLIFIVFVIATMALPCHLYSLTLEVEQGLSQGRDLNIAASNGITLEQFRVGLVISMAISILVGIAVTLWPMRIGIRAFEKREF
jgi:ABC-2 type transport system permease protein